MKYIIAILFAMIVFTSCDNVKIPTKVYDELSTLDSTSMVQCYQIHHEGIVYQFDVNKMPVYQMPREKQTGFIFFCLIGGLVIGFIIGYKSYISF